MRTISTDVDKLLDNGLYAAHVKLQIEDMDASMVEMTTLEGHNWVRRIQYGEDQDAPVMTMDVVLFAKQYSLSLLQDDENSKLNQDSGGSYSDPFLQVARQIVLDVAIVPVGRTPQAGDYFEAFNGKIDEVDAEVFGTTNGIVLRCRGKGVDLQDIHFIEDIESYGAGPAPEDRVLDNTVAGGALEDVIQAVLDNHTSLTLFSPNGTGGTPWNAGDSPGFTVTYWEIGREPLFEAIRRGAIASIGWDLRYRWHANTSDWQLQMFEPDRSPSSLHRTFAPDAVLNVRKLNVSVSDIRNKIIVGYFPDPDDPEPTYVTRQDASSQAKYGVRTGVIIEDPNSPIDSAAEANALGDAALADLKEPDREQEVELLYFPFVELMDYYRFTANNIHYTANKDWSVVSYRHSIDLQSGQLRTHIQTRSASVVLRKGWHNWFQFPGLAQQARNKVPAAPTVSKTEVVNGVDLSWSAPLSKAVLSHYEVHASTTASFTASSSTLVTRTNGTRYRYNGSDPTQTYYFQVIAVDQWGNKSAASSEVSNTPGRLIGYPGKSYASIAAAIADGLLDGQLFRVGDIPYRALDTDYDDDCLAHTPLILLKHDETSGSTATDSSGNGYDGTMTGATVNQSPLVPDGGKSVTYGSGANSGCDIDIGAGNEISVGAGGFTFHWVGTLNLDGTKARTLCAFGDATSEGPTDDWFRFRLQDYAGTPPPYEWFLDAAGDTDGGGSFGPTKMGGEDTVHQVFDGNVHHWALVLTATSSGDGDLLFYRDGRLIGKISALVPSGYFWSNVRYFTCFDALAGDTNTSKHTGSFDQWQFVNSELTSDEVLALATKALSESVFVTREAESPLGAWVTQRPVRFRASLSSADNPSSSSWTRVDLDQVDEDTHDGWDASNFYWVCPKTAYYKIRGSTGFSSLSADSRWAARIMADLGGGGGFDTTLAYGTLLSGNSNNSNTALVKPRRVRIEAGTKVRLEGYTDDTAGGWSFLGNGSQGGKYNELTIEEDIP